MGRPAHARGMENVDAGYFDHDRILAGFAGSAADSFALFGRFEFPVPLSREISSNMPNSQGNSRRDLPLLLK
jgi:ATP-dependent protease HslVU (ClpYQ) peptidase subunit